MNPKYKPNLLATAILLVFSTPAAVVAQTTEISLDEAATHDAGGSLSAKGSSQALQLEETRVLGTAEEEVKQALGVSVITADDIKKRPPVNDLSDIIRTMPGVNLTGNSSSGQRGNNRQIDIRGMGPENTLILIDGKPSTSRNAVRYGWRGERDTRGDSNWVPAEQVERIEVLRGPAAARYGSGAAGGVVNIITKRPTDKASGSLTLFTNLPEDGDEGATRRANFSLSGPLTEQLTYRVYGSANKTDADSPGINADHQAADPDTNLIGGREGVRNRDINSLLSWQLSDQQTLEFEAGFSRQGNIYAGDSQNANSEPTGLTGTLAENGAETNRMYRQNYAISHLGDWVFGTSRLTLAFDSTRNTRLQEGLGGRSEGRIANESNTTSVLDNYRLDGEVNLPIDAVFQQVVTIGGEWSESKLDDPGSTQGGSSAIGNIPGTTANAADRDSVSRARIAALYVEDNIELRPGTILTPGLRLDEHSEFGINWSPSLNGSQALNDQFTLKGGIARAFKAPNLYQSNPDYLLATNGNGCPVQIATGACYLVGNKDLDAEISVNKEIGIAFQGEQISSSLTYFRNDYKNKIVAGTEIFGTIGNYNVLQWSNAKKAVVEGLEGNLLIPLSDSLSWNTNFTYMLESIDKDTGNPLSLTPEYTVNSTLDWQASDRLSLQLSTVYYGEQEAPTNVVNRNDASGLSTESVDPYHIWGVSAGYAFTDQVSTRVGVSNIFDKRLYREGNANTAGANTYNEPGRALYLSLTTAF
ncbi:ferric enterobactin receptor [Pseudomonas flavescens]|uniref:Ferric enterobactin receptor n=1 Tax=Phytopseudomonas flavescens TaxID=29435 RepID=A0A1G7Y6P2_9GAMM|nr:FepA family TonB-dependent siderophore receptor [Pseudomonas flavescens]SDG92135.1 ferric enterobactin receptor [Pseudomonas flavescens]